MDFTSIRKSLRLTRQSAILSLVAFAMACGGGSCGGCSSCGIGPIPGGFPISERIDNSAQVRLTDAGIQYIEDHISDLVATFLPGGLDFPIPPTSTSTSVAVIGNIDVDVCKDGGCNIHGEINGFELIPTDPNRLQARLKIILDSRDDAGGRASLPIKLKGGCSFIGCLINTTCQADIDTRGGSRPDVGIIADIDFNEDTHPARMGYTRIDIARAVLDPDAGLEDADISFGSCSGISGAVINLASGLIKGQIIDQLAGQVDGMLQSAIGDQLCTQQGEFGCPTGTFADPADPADPTAVCRYTAVAGSECVPSLLGTDGQGDLGAQSLSGFSPGAHAPVQYLLASGGEGEAVNEGMSLFMYGGFLSTSRDFTTFPGHNPCVPVVDPPALPTIPRVDTFRNNSAPGLAANPHLGIGIAESYLNQVGYGLFDSGMLCIGTGTSLNQMLSTGLFGLIAPSLNNLSFPESSAALALNLRPQKPMTFDVGTDPGDALLTIGLPELQIDFYVWSSERYIRFMTYQADIEIPINLVVMDGEIVPQIVSLSATNSTVTNSELLDEPPAELAAAIEGILTMFADQLTGGLSGFALPDLMGIQLEIPEGGIQGIRDDGEDFLSIFANLNITPAAPTPLIASVETNLAVTNVTLRPEAMQLENWGQGEPPSVTLELSGDGPIGSEYEYSVRLDDGQWSAWSADANPTLESRYLLFQGRHSLDARARVAGAWRTRDLTPSHTEIVVDVSAPEVRLDRQEDGVRLSANDLVSPDTLEYRIRDAGGAWSEWAALPSDVVIDSPEDAGLEAEVRDESGNVGAAREALIRGIPNPAGGGCGCAVPGHGSTKGGPLALGGLLLLLGVVLGRRRRRWLQPGSRLRRIAARLPLLTLLLALPLGGCDCGGANNPTDGAVSDCDGGPCLPPARPLDPGQLATYLDVLAQADGTLVLSGYSAGRPPRTNYGDLVVGTWDAASSNVNWQIIDGVPSEAPITGTPDGWRGGVGLPGDDVGRWTSIGEQGGALQVSYYDKTNGALKFATGSSGPDGTWSVHVVDDEGDAGRFTSLGYTPDGRPAIAYLSIVGPAALPGRPTSRARVAMASSSAPAATTDWTLTDVTTQEIDCRPQYCPDGSVCAETGECLTPSTDCAADCVSGEACIAGSCAPVLEDGYVEDLPRATGLYNSLATTGDGLALVFYDRTLGDLYGATWDGTAWSAPFLIDGYTRGDPNTGDSGLSADLFIDAAGAWHVVYVDGAEEVLRYAKVEAGAVTTREAIDDGSTDGAERHTDGRHVVGDGASVVVTDGGEVRVAYQDTTSQNAMFARRAADGTWTVSVLDAEDSTGYWTRQVLVGGSSYVAEWWRREQPREERANGVRIPVVE
ncbi:MAG: hypothetical protein GXP55_15525 [Deltaproteobacteria bacterium]|nr:hypothetical protein [Deltaproteobacteria bacterium]